MPLVPSGRVYAFNFLLRKHYLDEHHLSGGFGTVDFLKTQWSTNSSDSTTFFHLPSVNVLGLPLEDTALFQCPMEIARIIYEMTSEEQASPVAANGPVP
jgi:hypothetical protein